MKKSYLILAACAAGAFFLLRQSSAKTGSTAGAAASSSGPAPASGIASVLGALLGNKSTGTIAATTQPYRVSDATAASPAPTPSSAGRVAVVGGSMPTGAASAAAAVVAAATASDGWSGSTQPTQDIWYDNTKTFQPGMLIHA